MSDGKQLHELSFMGWPLNDNDLLIMEDVSDPLPLKKIRLCSLRSAFVGGWPSLDEVPPGALNPPEFTVKGMEGFWRINIDCVDKDGDDTTVGTDWYFLYKYNYAKGEYDVVKAIPETRDPHQKGTPRTPLIYDYPAPVSDTPNRYYGKFKVRSVSHEYKGPLTEDADAKAAWTLYDFPPDFKPNAPTLLTTGGYPLTSYAGQKDGQDNYTISIKIQAPDGQKNFIKQYTIARLCDEGTGSFTGKKWEHGILIPKDIPRPKIVIWHDSDPDFVVGYKYRYLVFAHALNDHYGPKSNYQDITLADDTTPPDDPVFTVKTSPGNIDVNFDPIKVGGETCIDWAYILLQYRVNAGAWIDEPLEKTLSKLFDVAEADYSDEYEFRAKVFDYAGNENTGGWQTDPVKYTAGKVTELCFGTELYNKVEKIEINEGNIASHDTEISQNATDILLRATKTYVDGSTIKGAIEVNAGNITLKVAKNVGDECEILSQINLSSSGVRIGGIHLAIDSETTFTNDVEIQGILKSTGGIKTSAGGNRIELGSYLGLPDRLNFYLTGDKRIVAAGHVLTFYDTGGSSQLQMSSGGLSGGAGCFIYTQSYMKAGSYIRTENVFKVGANRVVGARKAAVAAAGDLTGVQATAGSDTINRANLNYLLGVMYTELGAWQIAINATIARLKTTGGHGLIAD